MKFRAYFPAFVEADPVPDVEVSTLEEILALPHVESRKTSQFKQFSLSEDLPNSKSTLMVELTNGEYWVVGFILNAQAPEELEELQKLPRWTHDSKRLKNVFVLKIGEPNKNKHFFPRHGIEKMVEAFNRRTRPSFGCLQNDITIENGTVVIRALDHTHQIDRLYIEDDVLRADIRMLNTLKAKMVFDGYLKGDVAFRLAHQGVHYKHVDYVEIDVPLYITIFATPNPA